MSVRSERTALIERGTDYWRRLSETMVEQAGQSQIENGNPNQFGRPKSKLNRLLGITPRHHIRLHGSRETYLMPWMTPMSAPAAIKGYLERAAPSSESDSTPPVTAHTRAPRSTPPAA